MTRIGLLGQACACEAFVSIMEPATADVPVSH
jgi:hypothetical protein